MQPVEQRQPPAAVLLDQREGRAADLVAIDTQAFREPSHQRGLPCSEIAVQQHDVAGLQRAGEIVPDGRGFLFGMGGDHFPYVRQEREPFR